IKSDDDVVAEEDNKLRSELISQKIRRQVERDIREILLYSGCEREAKYLLKNVDGMDGEEVAEILNLLKDVKETSEKRDKENRERYMSVVDIQQDVGETFLPVGSLTHGTQSQNLGIILDTGIFSGELLGSSGNADASGILGTDVSEVLADQDDFKKRFHGLSNYSSMNFGDVHLLMSDYKAGPNAENRNADAKAHMGPDHRLVRTGIPSSEITGVVVKDEKVIESVKKDLVIKGVFVPMMNKSGEMLFTPEEFDEMKIFYYDLSRLGYPTEVIDSVYEYHKDDSLSQKHRAVMDKAFAYASGGGEKFDWAVLVSFLRSNDLNRGSADWYQEGGTSFTDIMDFIKGRTKQKIREKSKRDIFSSIRRLNRDIIGSESQEDVEENQFIISFFQYQLPYTMFGKTFDELDEPEKEELYVEKKKYEKALAQLSLFATSPEIIAQAAHLFSEQKYDLMRKLWGEIWEEIGSEGDFDSGEVEEFKKLITPIVAGSGGRGELVLGSDLDYCLYVDDRGFSEEEKELKIKKIKHFVNNVLAEKINNILLRNRIRPDAGLANADRMPFTTFSTLKDFSINLQDRRQVVEPTEVLDGEPLFESDRWVAEEARDRLLVQNETAYLLPSYIEKDLELGEGKKSFVEEFEDLFVNVASGQMVERIKDSLQRSLIFKLDALLVNGLVDGSIPETMAKKIPSGIVDKISFLKDHKIFDDAEALVCRNLFAVGYKMRFLGELYSEEAKELSDTKKVKNVVFKVEDITYEERESLIDLLKKFKTDILYK
ncbi:hypothetical protein HON36_00005, partial [Candidatus Parcubacteria bacterium]|nr:hypothetical protein [Candidatus Parcubacteria bacterium]